MNGDTEIRFNVLDIIAGTSVDGPGLRTSIYLAGCNHHCHGCHNPESWDFHAGTSMSLDEIMAVVREEDFNVTLSGGDPLCSPKSTYILAKAIRKAGYGLWIYTGFTWEEIVGRDELKRVVELADVVVEGPFVESLRDVSLRFRGSSNQRIIEVASAL